jgi:maleate isomerase
MHGWSGRLGLIITSSDLVSEPEFNRYAPDGVAVHASRMLLKGGVTDAASLEQMSDDTERCAELLSTTDVDAIAYACTTGSLVKGLGFEETIERRIREVAGVPAVATAASIKRAFDALDVESVAIATPYIEDLNEREAEFLEASGYDVVDIDGLGLRTDVEIGSRRPETAYRQAREIDHEGAEAVFISCTGYRTFEIIERLEADIGKPVVTSNQATLWDALETLGIDYTGIDLGTLFDE